MSEPVVLNESGIMLNVSSFQFKLSLHQFYTYICKQNTIASFILKLLTQFLYIISIALIKYYDCDIINVFVIKYSSLNDSL